MRRSLPAGWRPIQPADAPAVAALIDEDEVFAGFRSRVGEIGGLVQAEAGRRGGGFVNWPGVRRPWRRRDLGQALLLQAFGELAARGCKRVRLGADAENPTGATRLYDSVGIRVGADHATFAKKL